MSLPQAPTLDPLQRSLEPSPAHLGHMSARLGGSTDLSSSLHKPGSSLMRSTASTYTVELSTSPRCLPTTPAALHSDNRTRHTVSLTPPNERHMLAAVDRLNNVGKPADRALDTSSSPQAPVLARSSLRVQTRPSGAPATAPDVAVAAAPPAPSVAADAAPPAAQAAVSASTSRGSQRLTAFARSLSRRSSSRTRAGRQDSGNVAEGSGRSLDSATDTADAPKPTTGLFNRGIKHMMQKMRRNGKASSSSTTGAVFQQEAKANAKAAASSAAKGTARRKGNSHGVASATAPMAVDTANSRLLKLKRVKAVARAKPPRPPAAPAATRVARRGGVGVRTAPQRQTRAGPASIALPSQASPRPHDVMQTREAPMPATVQLGVRQAAPAHARGHSAASAAAAQSSDRAHARALQAQVPAQAPTRAASHAAPDGSAATAQPARTQGACAGLGIDSVYRRLKYNNAATAPAAGGAAAAQIGSRTPSATSSQSPAAARVVRQLSAAHSQASQASQVPSSLLCESSQPSTPRSRGPEASPFARSLIPSSPRRSSARPGGSASGSIRDDSAQTLSRARREAAKKEAQQAHLRRAAALTTLPGMPKHLAFRIWEDLEEPKFQWFQSRAENEINSVYSALRGSTRSASGHSGALERRDSNDGTVLATSSMLSQALDSAASSMLSSQQGSVDLDCERLEVEGSVGQINVNLALPGEANCDFKRQDIVSKDIIALGQGSSAIVFEAQARQPDGAVVPVVIKERRPRCDFDEDLRERRIFADELKLSSKLTHRNIVFCHGGFVAPPDAPFPAPPSRPDFILFERCAASLSHYISCRYDEDRPHPLWLREGLDIGIGILNGLQWIHPGVTHGDLSSSNVLVKVRPNNERINTMCVMLADFETARVICREPMQHGDGLGTAAFIPPSCDDEVHRAQGFSDDWIYQVSKQAQHNRKLFGSILRLPSAFPDRLKAFFRDCWDQKIGSAALARNRLQEIKACTPGHVLDAPCLTFTELTEYQTAYFRVCSPAVHPLDVKSFSGSVGAGLTTASPTGKPETDARYAPASNGSACGHSRDAASHGGASVLRGQTRATGSLQRRVAASNDVALTSREQTGAGLGVRSLAHPGGHDGADGSGALSTPGQSISAAAARLAPPPTSAQQAPGVSIADVFAGMFGSASACAVTEGPASPPPPPPPQQQRGAPAALPPSRLPVTPARRRSAAAGRAPPR